MSLLNNNWILVAFWEKGVDRNFADNQSGTSLFVALHPEGVDRNKQYVGSLLAATSNVALHPEGVDKKRKSPAVGQKLKRAKINMFRYVLLRKMIK